MAPPESESSPSSGLHDGDFLLAGDEAERVGCEGDSARQAAEILIGFAPDRCTERSHGFLPRPGRRSARYGADPPLRTPGYDGCCQSRDRQPLASRRSDSGPRWRKTCLGETQRALIVGRRERCDDDIALELRVRLHDAHRQHRRGLVEQTLRRESGPGERENTPRRLQPNPLIGDAGRSAEEGQNVLRGLGVCEKKLVGHTL